MNNITVTVELCAEDRARLDKILAALEGHNCERCASGVANFVAANVRPPEPVAAPEKQPEAPAKAEPEAVNTPEPEKPAEVEKQPEAPAITLDQIQQKVLQLATANGGAKKAQARAIVNAYAPKISALPQDKWSEIWDKLTELEG